jgi:hypothetical protein
MAVGLGLTAMTANVHPIRVDLISIVVVVLAAFTLFAGPVVVEGQIRLSLSSVVLLSAMALFRPAEVGVVGFVVGWLQFGARPLHARFFNAGQSATIGVLGGLVYVTASGRHSNVKLTGAEDIFRYVGMPIFAASLVQIIVNLVLLVGMVRVGKGIPMRSTAVPLLRGTGPGYLGYGVIAFLLVVLWQSGGLGPASVILVLAPLLVARWAHVQLGDEVHGQGSALQVLVAAVEAKAPHLIGHSARVADLSARMAGRLGLRTQLVADARTAGMLHDLGQTALPTALVRGSSPGASELTSYPERGARMLRGLDFLSGSLDAIARHRASVARDPRARPRGSLASVVGLADEYDLLTEVGTPDGIVLSHSAAIQRLRGLDLGDDLVDALEWARARRPGGDR